MHLERKLKRVNSSTHLDSLTGDNKKRWMVWWYCGIYKNPKNDAQPNVLVAFRELSDSNSLSENLIFRRLPLTALGQLRVGSVWLDGICQQKAIFDIEVFDVDFNPGNWQFTSFQHTARGGREPPYPLSLYPLKYEQDRNWLIELRLTSGGKLIIPCLEFFSRCYGRSAELKRVLATYPWQGTKGGIDNRLYAPLDQPEEPGKWKVKLRKRLVNGDVIFLAHAKYDRYTEIKAKQIYAQIEANHDPEDKAPIFIEAGPWFRETAKIKVSGIWFDEGRSFLALHVIGCSDPTGALIERNRDNRNNAEQPADLKDQGHAWEGAPERVIKKPPEIIDITGDVEPDHGGGAVEIQDPDFEIIGAPRMVVDHRDKKAKDSAGEKGNGNSDMFSSGEPHGDGKGVGHASIHATPVLESHGALRDMWSAMLYHKEKSQGLITAVEWFTFEDGFQDSPEPKIIGLQKLTKEEISDLLKKEKEQTVTAIKNWPYLDSTTKTDMRGILVARLKIRNQYVHIVEIQRRPRKKKNSYGKIEEGEESFKGFAFKLKNQFDFEKYLRQFLSDIRYKRGIVQHLVGDCPGYAASFNHSVSNDDSTPCESAVLNALNKMKIDL